MKFYFDANITPQIVKALEVLQEPLREEIEVFSIAEIFGKNAADEIWLPEVGKQKGIVITQDINIHRTRSQRELYRKYDLGVIFLKPPKKKGIPYWDMIKIILGTWPDIKRTCENANRPFAYIIRPRKSKLERL